MRAPEPSLDVGDDALARTTEALVAAALAAIDDDAPTFADTLAAIAGAPAVLDLLTREPERAGVLFVELRKLRPVTLWVRDEASAALLAKRSFALDGALCRPGDDLSLPPAEARECWVELARVPDEAQLSALRPGYGLVVAGVLAAEELTALRRGARLRALGARALAPTAAVPPGLDLLVLPAGAPLPNEGAPARVLWLGSAEGAPHLPDHMPASSGVVCAAEHALSWALALASRRRRPEPSAARDAGPRQALVGEAAIVERSSKERGNGPRP